jgi:hypothetical protein
MLAGSSRIVPINRVKDSLPVFNLNYNRFIGLEEGCLVITNNELVSYNVASIVYDIRYFHGKSP